MQGARAFERKLKYGGRWSGGFLRKQYRKYAIKASSSRNPFVLCPAIPRPAEITASFADNGDYSFDLALRGRARAARRRRPRFLMAPRQWSKESVSFMGPRTKREREREGKRALQAQRNRNRGTEQPVLFILECRLSELSAGLFIDRS